jgi:hypothetical protein
MNKNKHIKSGRQIPNRSFFTKSTPYPQNEPGVTVAATFSKISYSQADRIAAFTFWISSALRLKSLFFSIPRSVSAR